ncbi:MAG TPA: DUF2267 domain-containing protein [Steroidobacteraceae bacterium]|nr:DUF2267 domain-containing protein [Steroidobacteraceae bacterium]
MHPTTTELFGETIAKTGRWLDELMSATGNSDPHRAYSVLRAVLHVLRDRLTVDEAVNLGAQLPMLVRGFYYEGWRPAGRPARHRHKAEFLQLVADSYQGLAEAEREPAVRAVFRILSRHITAGEVQHVKNQLPAEVRSLWE